jgi:hypothetical protein
MKTLYARTILIGVFVATCLALIPPALAVSPPPDGGYPRANTAEGEDALFSLTTGPFNTAVGFNALYSLTTGDNNTAVGINTLLHNTNGYANTAIGAGALRENNAFYNTGVGNGALTLNTTGLDNTATGALALYNNTTGSSNTAVGFNALYFNDTGEQNTAVGYNALYADGGGGGNTALGTWALYSGLGGSNTGVGANALENTSGDNNTATGAGALNYAFGNQNTATGALALQLNGFASNNTAMGYFALGNSTGNNNIAIGSYAGADVTTGGNNVDIGNRGAPADNKTIRIGVQGTQRAAFIAGINGATVPGGVGIIIGADGHLGTVTSSARYKEQIKPMDKASEAIMSLAPVTFRYKKELDPQSIPQFGLVAEQVEQVNPDLVARDEHGKPFTVRYEAVNAMLLNEFLKEHRKVEEQATTIAELKSHLDKLDATVKAQAAQIHKVSAEAQAKQSPLRMTSDN